jgi:hypothetical protein
MGFRQMSIIDRRLLRFDAAAIVEVISCSWHMSQKIGLPAVPPEGVQFDPAADKVTLLFGINGKPLPMSKNALVALLVNYCIRAKIKIPRLVERTICVEPDAVLLVFNALYPVPQNDLAAERPANVDQARSKQWVEPVHRR